MKNLKESVEERNSELEEIYAMIDVIYGRQKEVVIGKRNINCLSCAGGTTEPEFNTVAGADGKIYRGTPARNRPASIPSNNGESTNDRNTTLLSMKWEHIQH